MPKDDHLDGLLDRIGAAAREQHDPLAQAAAAVLAATQELDRRIGEARRHARPWGEIADQVGMSRQTAWNRWKHLEPERRKAMKTWQCPYCSTVATYRHNLKKHLMGTHAYGGHQLADGDAERILDEREFGTQC